MVARGSPQHSGPRLDDMGCLCGSSEQRARSRRVGQYGVRADPSDFYDPRSGLPAPQQPGSTGEISSRSGVSSTSSAPCTSTPSAFADDQAEKIFLSGVQRAIDLQGPAGEWPWMIGVPSGRVLDVYPVFSVHQDSMAMLFLLPAHDRAAPGTSAAIEPSLAWPFGANELSIDFYPSNPFHAFDRSSAQRELRACGATFAATPMLFARRGNAGEARVRLNPECRSYHLGWILYVWSSRPEVDARTVPRTTLLTRQSHST